MTIWGNKRAQDIRRALSGTHGLYAIVSIVKARKCFNTTKIEYSRESPLLFRLQKGAGKDDVVRHAGKGREAL